MGKSSQKKGRSGEIELSQIFNENGINTHPGKSMSFGSEPDITGLPGIHIEVKRVEKLNVSEAMKQSIRDSEQFHDGIPALFHRRNREQWLVTMRLSDWIRLYREWIHEQIS